VILTGLDLLWKIILGGLGSSLMSGRYFGAEPLARLYLLPFHLKYKFYTDSLRHLLHAKRKLIKAVEEAGLQKYADVIKQSIRTCISLNRELASNKTPTTHSFQLIDWPTSLGDPPLEFACQVYLKEVSEMVASYEYNLPVSGYIYFFVCITGPKIVVAEGEPEVKKIEPKRATKIVETSYSPQEYLSIPDAPEFGALAGLSLLSDSDTSKIYAIYNKIRGAFVKPHMEQIFGWSTKARVGTQSQEQTLMYQFCGAEGRQQYLFVKTENVKQRKYKPVLKFLPHWPDVRFISELKYH